VEGKLLVLVVISKLVVHECSGQSI